VREVGLGESLSGGGRPARLLEFNDASAAYLGIHFGVRATRIAVADARGIIRVVRKRPSLSEAAGRVGKVVQSMVSEALQAARIPRARVAAAGATVPGLVDQETGVCVLAPNLAWRDVPLREILQDELRVPVVVNNITQASAVAEGRVGAARGVRSYVWLYVGSGVARVSWSTVSCFTGKAAFAARSVTVRSATMAPLRVRAARLLGDRGLDHGPAARGRGRGRAQTGDSIVPSGRSN